MFNKKLPPYSPPPPPPTRRQVVERAAATAIKTVTDSIHTDWYCQMESSEDKIVLTFTDPIQNNEQDNSI